MTEELQTKFEIECSECRNNLEIEIFYSAYKPTMIKAKPCKECMEDSFKAGKQTVSEDGEQTS